MLGWKTFLNILIAIIINIFFAILFANAADFRSKADLVVESLTREDFQAVYRSFTGDARKELSAAQLEQIWERLKKQCGSFQSYGYTGEETGKGITTYIYDLQFKRVNFSLRISMDSTGSVGGLWFRPGEVKQPVEIPYDIPSYVDTTRFTEINFVWSGKHDIPASIVFSRTNDKNPVVLLVQGSGPLDRNETIGPNQPMRDIAWGLATLGVASVRFDNRAYVVGIDKSAELDLEEYLLDDMRSLLAYIRSRPEIDTSRIFIAGHSLGGIVAPLVAEQDGRIAGLIMMATPARKITDVVIDQFAYLATLEDSLDTFLKQQLVSIRTAVDMIEAHNFDPGQLLIFASGQVWYDLLDSYNYDIARRLDLPMLIIQGGRDYQSTDEDFQMWRKAFAADSNVTLKRYANLNHLFQPGKGKATNLEYTTNTAPVDSLVIHDIATWVKSIGN
jgi:alpha-beta hydrolase superfamily lysophospholipase